MCRAEAVAAAVIMCDGAVDGERMRMVVEMLAMVKAGEVEGERTSRGGVAKVKRWGARTRGLL